MNINRKNILETKHFCIAPWVHMSVYPNGDSFPCCSSEWGKNFSNINEDGLVSAWNSERMKSLRLNSSNDLPTSTCSGCYEKERVGIRSYRNFFNEKWGDRLSLLSEMEEDGSVARVNMPFFDIRWSNLCNMKCRTCGPEFSSRWLEDRAESNSKVTKVNTGGAFWEDLMPILQTVEEIYFSGGEPMIMDEHYKVLKMFKDINHFPKIVYNSNGSKLNHLGESVISLWEEFPEIEYCISLDHIGAKAEYIRHGVSFKTIEKNIKEVSSLGWSKIKIRPSPVISIFNILELDRIIEYCIDNNMTNNGFNLSNVLAEPSYFSICSLNPALTEKAILSVENAKKIDHGRSFSPSFEGIKNLLLSKNTFEKHKNRFSREIFEIDQKRNESFLQTFPELSSQIQ